MIAHAPGLAHLAALARLNDSAWPIAQRLAKPDRDSPCLIKTGAQAISIKAGTAVLAAAGVARFAVDTPVTLPTLTPGEDYSVWVRPDGLAVAVADPYHTPAAAPAPGAVKLGGFHYGLVAPGETVAGGGFATTGNGMIWTQADVDALAGINRYSIWDLKFRPSCDPRGMALVAGRFWADLYFCGTNHATNGTSRYNTDVASGTVLPKIPAEFGGDGTAAYANLTWWVAVEIATAHKKRLPLESEFVAAAFGVTENQSLGGSAVTIPATARQPGYTSKWGLEQATGHHYAWGADASYRHDGTAAWAWRNVTGGRGNLYLYTDVANVRVRLGGNRISGSLSGSRASNWDSCPWNSSWAIGLRALGDHLILD